MHEPSWRFGRQARWLHRVSNDGGGRCGTVYVKMDTKHDSLIRIPTGMELSLLPSEWGMNVIPFRLKRQAPRCNEGGQVRGKDRHDRRVRIR